MTETKLDKMLQRAGSASAWTSANPTLEAGELGVELDTGKMKIGNGTTDWLGLAYFGGGGGGDPAIGGPITGATLGSILFASAAGIFGQDNANLFWDALNTRLGIGTDAPRSLLDVLGQLEVQGNGLFHAYLTEPSGQPFIDPSGRTLIDSAGAPLLSWFLGKIGIGTATPRSTLDVIGQLEVQGPGLFHAVLTEPSGFPFLDPAGRTLIDEAGAIAMSWFSETVRLLKLVILPAPGGPSLILRNNPNTAGVAIYVPDGIGDQEYIWPLNTGALGMALTSIDGFGTLGWAYPGGGLVEDITLLPADILTLNSVPIPWVVAPGAGKAIIVDSVEYYLAFNSVPYDGGGNVSILYTGDINSLIQIDNGTGLSGSANYRNYQTAYTYGVGYTENAGITVTGGADSTVGNSTVKMRLRYHIIDVLT